MEFLLLENFFLGIIPSPELLLSVTVDISHNNTRDVAPVEAEMSLCSCAYVLRSGVIDGK